MIYDPPYSASCYAAEIISAVTLAPTRHRDSVIDNPLPPGQRLTGIDVSHHQGYVEWHKVAEAGHTFAYAKATEGVDYVDPRWKTNRTGARLAGMRIFGGYHFASWWNCNRRAPAPDAIAEAHDYLEALKPTWSGMLPPVLDLEWSRKEPADDRVPAETIVEWALRWLEEVEAESGLVPMIYTGPNFVARLGKHAKHLKRFPLWLARYSRWRGNPTRVPSDWPWVIWQHTGSGTCDGVKGRVDLNEFAGSAMDLLQFAGLPYGGGRLNA